MNKSFLAVAVTTLFHVCRVCSGGETMSIMKARIGLKKETSQSQVLV